MPAQISNHRMGAFVYGFLSGVGLIMIIWGLASIATLPTTNLLMNVGLVLFGVTLLACGSCREAYLRGNLTAISDPHISSNRNQSTEPSVPRLVTEQIVGIPEEVSAKEPNAS